MIFGKDDDIEILDIDIDDNLEILGSKNKDQKEKVKEESKSNSREEKFREIELEKELKEEVNLVKEKSKKKKEKKDKKDKKEEKKNNKYFKVQLIFCLVSITFILGCCIFYGSRLFKYYRIYNPKPTNGTKVSLFANKITGDSEIVYEGDGLYISAGNYIYKGNVNNNYVKYNNMLYRIVRVNKDDTMVLISNDYINVLNWDKEKTNYLDSNINKYLNEYYAKMLNKNILTNNSVCLDNFDNLSNITCNNKNSDHYVNLLNVSDFLNSIVDGKSYLVKDEEIFWLNDSSSDKVWHTNGVNVSMSESNNFYEVKPVITLKATAIYYSGDGSIENPYIIEEKNNKLEIGSYVKLGEDTWIVYNKDNNLKLTLNNVIDKQYRYSNSGIEYNLEIDGSLAKYLNTTYLESLSYKDVLKEDSWYIGSYNGFYKDVLDSEAKAKVGILNLMDLKLNATLNNYLLSSFDKDGLVYTYGEVLKVGKTSVYRNIRPCISVSSDIKIISGTGSESDPFVLEV